MPRVFAAPEIVHQIWNIVTHQLNKNQVGFAPKRQKRTKDRKTSNFNVHGYELSCRKLQLDGAKRDICEIVFRINEKLVEYGAKVVYVEAGQIAFQNTIGSNPIYSRYDTLYIKRTDFSVQSVHEMTRIV